MSVEPVAQRFPREFTYFDTKDRPFGTALTERMSRLAGTDVTLDDESAEAMGAALDAGDRLGDAWYADARRRGTVRAARNEFNAALEHGVHAVNDPSPALVALFDQIHTEPEWLDWDLLE